MSVLATSVEQSIDALERGDPVLIYDFNDREGEVDLVYNASAVRPADVARMRGVAGGLICVAIPDSVAERFDLPFLSDAIDHPANEGTDLGYDERSSFSLPVNHRDTYTGITDADRSRTITALADAAAAPGAVDFAGEFHVPGHIPVLRGAPGLLDDRQGHTELSLALQELTEAPPATVVCEMLDGSSGRALSQADARRYAERNGLCMLDGAEVIDYFE